MFRYEEVKNDKKLIMALTGISKEEFEKLVPIFEESWEEYINNNYKNREERKRKYGGGRKENLENIKDKLLFILYYTKVYPLQEVLAFEFGMSQSTANEWIYILSTILKETLDKGKYLPERNPEEIETKLDADNNKEYAIDGTERRIHRPSNEAKQEQYYSGKKKPTHLKILSLALSKLRKSSI
jgi:hypothetical protein